MSNSFANFPFPGNSSTEEEVNPLAPATAEVTTEATTEAVNPLAPATAAPTEAGTDGANPLQPTVTDEKPKKEKRFTNRRKTPDEIKFIMENYKNTSTGEIAKTLKLTRQQVYRTVLDARKSYLEKAKLMPEDKAALIIEWVETHLPTRDDDSTKGKMKRGSMVDNMFDELFKDLL